MLIVVSPAKSLDYESPLATKKFSEPEMLDRSEELVSIMAKKSPDDISALMSVSPALGELNFARFQDWERPFTTSNARPALLAFNGDVYTGMDAANSFSERDFTHAQKTAARSIQRSEQSCHPSSTPIANHLTWPDSIPDERFFHKGWFDGGHQPNETIPVGKILQLPVPDADRR